MNDNRVLVELADSVGNFIEYWGFRSIDGRVWTLIFLSKSPISTPEIVKTLGVSKGLVSIAINELLDFELIVAKEKVEHGAQTYGANMDIAKAIRGVLKNRELKKIQETELCIDTLSSYSPEKLASLNVSSENLKKLSVLTKINKGILKSLTLKKVKSLDDWVKFLKRCKRFI